MTLSVTQEQRTRPQAAPFRRWFGPLGPGSIAVGGLIAVSLGAAAFVLHGNGEGAALSLSIIFGALFGIVLQRARFCFFCNFRDWFERREPQGMLAILIALGAGIAGYTLIFGAWLPDASGGRLPPDAFIGPVSLALVAAGIAFGLGMAVSGSCVSAHLYRLGEGSPTAPFALVGTAAGFALGFATWNPIYLAAVANAPVLWLPARLGYAGALLVALVVLGGLAYALTRGAAQVVRASVRTDWREALLVRRWPFWAGGLAVGALGTAAYLRVAPLGVTAEISAQTRGAANALGLLPERLEGLDTLRGCVSIVRDALLTPNGAFVSALVLAAFASALVAGQFKPERPRVSHVVRGLAGGVLLGWGAMIGLGCTVGTLLSGIMAGAVSGWVFGAAIFATLAATFSIKRRFALP